GPSPDRQRSSSSEAPEELRAAGQVSSVRFEGGASEGRGYGLLPERVVPGAGPREHRALRESRGDGHPWSRVRAGAGAARGEAHRQRRGHVRAPDEEDPDDITRRVLNDVSIHAVLRDT